MSNPQGPERHREDAAERTGEIPAWGTPPPGGWGEDPAATGAWSPEHDQRAGWADPGADAGWDPSAARQDAGRDPGAAEPLWGDEGTGDDDGWAVPTGRRRRRRAAEADAPTEAVPTTSPAAARGEDARPGAASDGSWGGGAWENPGTGGEQPWVSRDAVQGPSRTRLYVLAGIGAVVVAALVLGSLFWTGVLGSDTLDRTALQAGVNQVLSRDYGLQVGEVACPDDVAVSAGTRFTCQAVVDGEQVEVPVVVTSDQGDYQVSRV
ncbi:DUF4333 domain-containing protein [Pseudonocardia spirodelae]|uniref:DUF4333 domain-containing protein n=1 Tax=Pseudonocardia spirodelae TaxID=3133431 RepID=A0ABU8T9Z4_9PSEU